MIIEAGCNNVPYRYQTDFQNPLCEAIFTASRDNGAIIEWVSPGPKSIDYTGVTISHEVYKGNG
jgi:hypothetical protein